MPLRPAMFACALLVCVGSGQTFLRAQAPPACPATPSHIVLGSGTFSSQPGVSFRLRHLDAMLVPQGKSAPACFQRVTVVAHAEIFISNDSLTRLFTQKLSGSDSKIKDFKVENGVGKVTLSGKITHIVPIQFTIEGPVTTDGNILRIDASKIKADGVPVKALLGIVGEHLNSVLALKGMTGFSVQDNTILFSPEQVAHIRGHIDSVETSPEGLTLHYGHKPLHPAKDVAGAQKAPTPPVPPTASHGG